MPYHWIITVQFPVATGSRSVTMSGVVELLKGSTRAQAFEEVLQALGEKVGNTNLNVLFFALEPNEL
jgi:hypothetical protein